MNENLISVEPLNKKPFRHIDWQMHNVCNFDCSYCYTDLKSGTKRWLSIEEYKLIVDKFVALFEGKPFMITYTAGEPTLFPKFLELLEYVKSKNGVNELVTNGSRTFRYWEELVNAQLLDFLCLSVHPESVTDINHYIDILNLVHDLPVSTAVEVLHTKDTIKRAIEYHLALVEKTGSQINMRAMYNMTYDGYSKEDLDYVSSNTYTRGKLFNSKKQLILPENLNFPKYLIVTYDDEHKSIQTPSKMIKSGNINYYGWECYPASIFRIRYDEIYSSTCVKTPSIGSIYDAEYKMPSGFNICPSTECYCIWDHSLVKKRPESTKKVIPIISI